MRKACARGAAVAGVCALAAASGSARGEQGAPGPAPSGPAGCVHGPDLMSAEENQAHRTAVQAATTAEARQKLMFEFMAAMRKRAAERGQTLCRDVKGGGPGGKAGPPGMGMGMGKRMQGPPGGPPPAPPATPPQGSPPQED
jgi:hypothetical protein